MSKKINIIHFVGGEENSGAFRGAQLLHNDLKNKNIVSNLFHESNNSKLNSFFTKLRKNYEKSPKIFYPKRKSTPFSSAIIGKNFLKNINYLDANIVHLHWINGGFFNISYLDKINKPVVWTIRDMWPFTGGCHYTLGCEKYETQCKACPQLGSFLNYDLSSFNQNRKLNFIQNKKISFVVNSKWMEKMAKKSKILKNETIHTFFPSFDLKNFFFDYDEFFVKNLNLNKNKKIILFGAQNIEAEYKGYKYFLKALDYLDKKNFFIIFFGNFWNEGDLKKKGFEYLKLGFIKDHEFQRKLYSLSDLFVACSIQEGFPKTVAEAILCHTPIVYFKNTAIEDICEHKIIGGYGAEYCNSEDLAKGINWISERSNYSETLIKKGIDKIKNNFNSEILVGKYLNLYNSLI